MTEERHDHVTQGDLDRAVDRIREEVHRGFDKLETGYRDVIRGQSDLRTDIQNVLIEHGKAKLSIEMLEKRANKAEEQMYANGIAIALAKQEGFSLRQDFDKRAESDREERKALLVKLGLLLTALSIAQGFIHHWIR